jgi:hypothetical protein
VVHVKVSCNCNNPYIMELFIPHKIIWAIWFRLRVVPHPLWVMEQEHLMNITNPSQSIKRVIN